MNRRKTIGIAAILLLVFISEPVFAEGNSGLSIYVDLWTNQLFVIKQNKVIETFPISPGSEHSPTPIGSFEITEKSKSWGGGFGSRWLGLNVPWGNFGIHGTNKPWLIGKKVSSGCVRMLNSDVEKLFEQVPIGTKVQISGPIFGEGDGELRSLSIGSKGNLVQLVQQRLKAAGYLHGQVDGIFDERTKHAVIKYQKDAGLPQTGSITSIEYKMFGFLE